MNGSFKLLPLLIVVVILSFSVRFTELVTGISNISNTAFAEAKEKQQNKVDDGKNRKDTAKTDNNKEGRKAYNSGGNSNGSEGDIQVVEGEKSKAPLWRDAGDSDIDSTGIKLELFKDLSKRRDLLDQREKEINAKEALLKAAEQEITRKYQELSKLRNEIESLLTNQSEEEEKRINSLVKIYEGMKPKDAARIFDTLDLDVLLSVISKMSERKVSPILASMNPERVRTITIMLAEQKSLPTLR